jgi:hypothetical protein
MTFRVTDGRQYLVIAAGGHGSQGMGPLGDYRDGVLIEVIPSPKSSRSASGPFELAIPAGAVPTSGSPRAPDGDLLERDLTGQFVPDSMHWRGEPLQPTQDHSAQ